MSSDKPTIDKLIEAYGKFMYDDGVWRKQYRGPDAVAAENALREYVERKADECVPSDEWMGQQVAFATELAASKTSTLPYFAKWRLNETSGVVAKDEMGEHHGTYVGGTPTDDSETPVASQDARAEIALVALRAEAGGYKKALLVILSETQRAVTDALEASDD